MSLLWEEPLQNEDDKAMPKVTVFAITALSIRFGVGVLAGFSKLQPLEAPRYTSRSQFSRAGDWERGCSQVGMSGKRTHLIFPPNKGFGILEL